ncbi:hypothetical protein FHR24_001479 [Wenyingzhuangia heitensis]|uniref:Uncharacterized protein n=1 Tax=Wenyingzhuangia heitensis TaxID=1487859 RepID=A0ABX0UB38_9FLAO|nr:hypothetical protein [Wenyingzhuangia heitensis]NIJ45040.1 hypothetical protein [Wenyingzhuangia heitensis]
MRVTKFFKTKSEMTAFAKEFAKEQTENWYLRTTLPCNHAVKENRKAIVLVTKERITQRLICCGTCKNANSLTLKS